ncbi:16S rRNA (guanine(527)-N(7))-methyltransferase RsmG [Planctomycetaceae bacterium]|jgi:16S rRNA (guanine527-N7)-methyltransferase|nr:16S rRNA (guanine(527)-N(7))-methyltransferase RsmG [Planctomycetaceae bacterium]
MTDSLAPLLSELLPDSISMTETQISQCARHLELVLETNKQFNLTSITEPREAVIKHIIDSLLPSPFYADAKSILDLGTGAGYPGIPLAILYPEMKVHLVDSTQKKARFLQEVVNDLGLTNVVVHDKRGETVLKSLPTHEIDILTARAVGSIEKILNVLKPVRKRFVKMLLFKGQRAEQELESSAMPLKNLKLTGEICFRYELPEEMGSHCVVEIG